MPARATRSTTITASWSGSLPLAREQRRPETVAWATAENELTEVSSQRFPPGGDPVKAHRTVGLTQVDVPFERGGLWFQTRNTGLQDQPVLWVMNGPDAEAGSWSTPTCWPGRHGGCHRSGGHEDGSKVAYSTSSAGSDWRVWRSVTWQRCRPGRPRRVVEVRLTRLEDGRLRFLLLRHGKASTGAELVQESGPTRIFLHRLGTRQIEDELVFAPAEPNGSRTRP